MLKKNNNNRIVYFDNLKFFLILAVVLGHAADYYTKTSTMMRYLYFFIYTFHMPLFIGLSGYFMKGLINKEKFRIDKIISYLLLYITMQSGNFIMKIFIMKETNPKFNFFSGSGPWWYLMAMMFWPCLMYILKNIKKVYVLIVSMLIALVVGYDRNVRDFLCLSRVIVFFPFFASGYYLTESNIVNILKNKILKVLSLMAMSSIIILILIRGDFIYLFRGLLTARNPYELLKVPYPELGCIYRLLIYILMVVMSLAVLYIIPKFEIPFITKRGGRTLQVYILHFFVLNLISRYKLTDILMNAFPDTWKWLYLFIGIIITIILSSGIFEYPFKKIMQIKLDKIYK